jgi:hypothetical protein
MRMPSNVFKCALRAILLALISSTAVAETLKLSGARSPLVNGIYKARNASWNTHAPGSRAFMKVGSDGSELEGASAMTIAFGPWGGSIGEKNDDGWFWVIVRSTIGSTNYHYVPYAFRVLGEGSGYKSHLPPFTGWKVTASVGQAPLPHFELLCDAGEYLDASQPPTCTVCSNGTYQANEMHRDQACIRSANPSCSGVGVFDVTVGCICETGFGGSGCELHSDLFCNGLGTVTPAGSCECVQGALGDHCQCIEDPENPGGSNVCIECARGYESSMRDSTDCVRCSDGGEWVPSAGICKCNDGWNGDRCECFKELHEPNCKRCDHRYTLESGACVLTPDVDSSDEASLANGNGAASNAKCGNTCLTTIAAFSAVITPVILAVIGWKLKHCAPPRKPAPT